MTKGASRWLENLHAVQYLLPFLDEQSIISLSALNKAALSAVQTSGYAQLQLLAYLHHEPEYAKRRDEDYWTCIHRIAELERNVEILTPRHMRVFKTPSSLDFYDFGHGSLAFNDLEYPVQLYRLTGEPHVLETGKVLDLRTLVARHLFGEAVEPTRGFFKGKANQLVTAKGQAPNRITSPSDTLASPGPTHFGSGFRGATLSPSSGLRAGRMFFGPFVDNGEMELRCEDVNERRANWKAGPVGRRLGALIPVSTESPTPTTQLRTEYLRVTRDKHHKCPIEPWAAQKGWKLRCDIFARDAAVSRLCFDGRSMMIQCDAETDGGSGLIILDF